MHTYLHTFFFFFFSSFLFLTEIDEGEGDSVPKNWLLVQVTEQLRFVLTLPANRQNLRIRTNNRCLDFFFFFYFFSLSDGAGYACMARSILNFSTEYQHILWNPTVLS